MERVDWCNGECKRDLGLSAWFLRVGCGDQSFGCHDDGNEGWLAMVYVLLHNGKVTLTSSLWKGYLQIKR